MEIVVIVAVIAILLILMLAVTIYASRYHRAGPNQALVVSGRRRTVVDEKDKRHTFQTKEK